MTEDIEDLKNQLWHRMYHNDTYEEGEDDIRFIENFVKVIREDERWQLAEHGKITIPEHLKLIEKARKDQTEKIFQFIDNKAIESDLNECEEIDEAYEILANALNDARKEFQNVDGSKDRIKKICDKLPDADGEPMATMGDDE